MCSLTNGVIQSHPFTIVRLGIFQSPHLSVDKAFTLSRCQSDIYVQWWQFDERYSNTMDTRCAGTVLACEFLPGATCYVHISSSDFLCSAVFPISELRQLRLTIDQRLVHVGSWGQALSLTLNLCASLSAVCEGFKVTFLQNQLVDP